MNLQVIQNSKNFKSKGLNFDAITQADFSYRKAIAKKILGKPIKSQINDENSLEILNFLQKIAQTKMDD